MTSRRFTTLGMVLLGWLLSESTATVSAQSSLEACFNTDAATSLDRRIEACTSIIESAGLPPVNLAVAFQNRASAHVAKDDNDRAIRDYDEAIRLNPSYANAFNGRAVAYEAKGDNEHALRDYSEAIRIAPDNANAFNGRCWLRAALRQLQEGLADCNESLRLRPNNSNTLDSRAFIYLQLSRFDEALADSEAALQANPRNAWALFERGVARLRKGDLAGGNADIAASRTIDAEAEADFVRLGVKP